MAGEFVDVVLWSRHHCYIHSVLLGIFLHAGGLLRKHCLSGRAFKGVKPACNIASYHRALGEFVDKGLCFFKCLLQVSKMRPLEKFFFQKTQSNVVRSKVVVNLCSLGWRSINLVSCSYRRAARATSYADIVDA